MTRTRRQLGAIALASVLGVALAAAAGEAHAGARDPARPDARAAGSAARPSSAGASAATAPQPTATFTARRLRARPGAVARGTVVRSSQLLGDRVFSDARRGFALANLSSAQYPARTLDGGHTWTIDGPQFHIDAADAPEAVSWVGVAGARTLYAYGSSAVDVTSNGGRTWWETFLGELVTAVVPGPSHSLIAYVQASVSSTSINPAVTWQYQSRDAGRHWHYSTALGGLP